MIAARKISSPADEHEEPKFKYRKDQETVKELLERAHDILREADESYIANNSGPRRVYPTFDLSEVEIGPLLGTGGFGNVFEVSEFRLSATHQAPFQIDNEDVETNEANDKGDETSNNATKSGDHPVELSKLSDDENHYDIINARTTMSRLVRRNGTARYAIKRLQDDLNELERTRGMIDLALEAKYLSVLWHPNIIKMRGISSGSSLEPNFFIIMDRLYEIMDQRFEKWIVAKQSYKGGLFGLGANRDRLHELLVERLTVAYDIAAALCYMHEHHLVYRDLKPENVGFDIRGDLKIFDGGLCKTLTPTLKARDERGNESYGFQLTPRTGSIPFMAPEVAECKPYDTQCDVFSFAILLWEILSLKPAFDGYTRREFYVRVVKHQERPTVPSRSCPPLVRVTLREGWDHDPQKRPNMKRVAALLRGALNDLTTDPTIRDRTTHMKDRSSHSQRIAMRSLAIKSSHGA